MTYKMQSDIAGSHSLLARVVGCAASEGIPDPYYWTYSRAWQLSAQPGWGDRFIDASAAGVEDPGDDEDVITDAMIRDAVQALHASPTHSA